MFIYCFFFLCRNEMLHDNHCYCANRFLAPRTYIEPSTMMRLAIYRQKPAAYS